MKLSWSIYWLSETKLALWKYRELAEVPGVARSKAAFQRNLQYLGYLTWFVNVVVARSRYPHLLKVLKTAVISCAHRFPNLTFVLTLPIAALWSIPHSSSFPLGPTQGCVPLRTLGASNVQLTVTRGRKSPDLILQPSKIVPEPC